MSEQVGPRSATAGGAVPESDRLAQLAAYELLEREREVPYDDLAALAADLCAAPIALVSIVGSDRQWFKAKVGVDIEGSARRDALCDWSIRLPGGMLVVPDAAEDDRFADNPLVLGPPHIRFYAGVPLRAREGGALGTVCVIDRAPREGLSPEQASGLTLVGRLLERELELRRVTLELLRSRARAQALLEHAADLALVLDSHGRTTWVSGGVEGGLGAEVRIAPGDEVLGLFHPDDVTEVAAALGEALTAPGRHPPFRARAATGNGHRWVEVAVNNQLQEPDIGGVLVQLRDMTAQRRLEERLRRLADHDTLTGLPNRTLLWARLEGALRAGRAATVLFIDLDEFKRINDEHGHDVGDAVLVTVAERLRAAVKEGDTAARLGGDEFVVLVPGVGDAGTAEGVARRLREALAGPVKVGDRLVHPEASIGWSTQPAATSATAAELLSRADHAMYSEKQRRRSGGPSGPSGG